MVCMYVAKTPYMLERPHVLVVACSDGRLQSSIDDFLGTGLGIREYDRLMVPGGPGALTGNGMEHSRCSHMNAEVEFLIEAHQIAKLILLFHGPAPDGLPTAVCADYARVLATEDPAEIRRIQERDAQLLREQFTRFREVAITTLWAEVNRDLSVQFVEG